MANRETREVELKFTSKGLGQTTAKVNKLKDTALIGATQATEKLNKGMKDLSASSGLAGATINALGQGIGDAQYGFGAVANNISQVGSLFGMLVAKSEGVKGAMKDLGKQMIGPMGIMFAFQLVVAAVNFLSAKYGENSKKAKELAKSQKELYGELGKTTAELHALRTATDFASMSDEKRAETLAYLNDKYKDANFQLDENNQLTEASIVFINETIEKLKSHVKNKKLQAEAEAVYSKELEYTAEIGIINNDILRENDKLQRLRAERQKAMDEGRSNRAYSIDKQIQATENRIDKANDKLGEFIDKRVDSQEQFNAIIGKMDMTSLNNPTKEGKKTASTPFDTPEKRQNYINKLKTDVESLQAELDAEDLELDFGLLGSKTDDTGYNSEEDAEYQNLLSKYELLGMTEYESELALINQKEQLALLEAEKFEDNEELKTAITEHYSNKRLDLAKKESEGEMTMMQKTTAGLRAASRIAGNMAGENKAMKIASTGIATSAGIMQAFAQEKTPFFLKLLNAGVVATQGAKNIASIKATKIPFANNSSGGGASVQAPAFNVIGQSVQSGLANVENAINAGNSQPVQAYVVESEITSQQQLNRTANNNSSI